MCKRFAVQECAGKSVACVLHVAARGVVVPGYGNERTVQALMCAARLTDLPLLRAGVAGQRAAATGGDAMK